MVDTSHYAPDYKISIEGVNLQKDDELSAIMGDRPLDILSITINETVDQADTFALTLRSRHRQVGRFPSGNEMTWIDDDRLKVGKQVELEMGYVGNRTLTFMGRITATNTSFGDSGIITVRVDGQSLYGDLFRRYRRQAFANKADDSIASVLARDLKLDVQADPTDIEHATVSNPDASYGTILQERAKRLYYEVKVKGKKLYFQKPRYLVDLNPQVTLTWGRDLVSFSPRIKTNGLATHVEVRNPRTQSGGSTQPLVGVADASSVPPRLGKRSGPQIVREMWGETKVLSDDQEVSTPEEARTVAVAQYRRSAIDFIEADGSTIGDPRLVSQTVIKLMGLGDQLSGLYYVTSSTHTLDANGYRTNFHAKRDGL